MTISLIINTTFDQPNNTLSTSNSPTRRFNHQTHQRPTPTNQPNPINPPPSNIPSHHHTHQTPKSHDPKNKTPHITSHPTTSPQQSKHNGPLRSLNIFPTSHSPPRLPLARNDSSLLGNLHDHIRSIPDNELCQNGESAEYAWVGYTLVSEVIVSKIQQKKSTSGHRSTKGNES